MTRYTVIDPASLAPMQVVEVPDKEQVIEDRMDRLVAIWTEYDPPMGAIYDSQGLEFEPLKINQELSTEREIMVLNRINHAARSVTLAYAMGTDLDAIASRYPGGVPRTPAETYTAQDGPVERARKDDRYRRRIWLAPNALSPHGVDEAYVFHAMSGFDWVKDATSFGIEGTPNVVITVMREGPDPIPTAQQLLDVRAYLHDEGRRGATDILQIFPPEMIPTRYDVDLWLYPGADADAVQAKIQEDLEALVDEQYWLGQDHVRMTILGKCAIRGVQNAIVNHPTKDIFASPRQLVRVTDVGVHVRGRAQ